MFADDIALISETEENMQLMLNALYQWCNKWQLNLNMSKTKIVHCHHNTQRWSYISFKYGNEEVQLTEKYKYLEFWIHEKLDMKYTALIM